MITVLVAEDERPILRNIVKAIESADNDFCVKYRAFNGKQAKEYLDLQDVDVAFLDINMPIYDGLTLLSYIYKKSFKVFPVILTGYREFDYAKKALQNHAFDYLLKPLKEEELKELLVRLKKELEIREKKKYFMQNEEISKEMLEKSGGG